MEFDLIPLSFVCEMGSDHPKNKSIGELSSALLTSSLEYLASVCGGHSLAEAVNLISGCLFGLICSFHFDTVLSSWLFRSISGVVLLYRQYDMPLI